MLTRVLETEVMDTLEEARDYDAMDHSEVNRLFVDDLLAAGPLEGEVLDLGTGTALIPVELCKRNEEVRVVAVDLAVQMLDLARYNVEVEVLSERIMLDRIDAKELPYEEGRFAAVISNSIVHHIAQPARVMSEAARVLAVGGLLIFRDLLRPADKAAVQQLVETYTADENEHALGMFAASLRAALRLDEVRQLVQEAGFKPQTVQITSDRHWTCSARKGG